MSNPDVNDFLKGGGGAPSASFDTPGTIVRGTIVRSEVTQQTEFQTGAPKFWSDGKPMMQAVITLQTDERSAEVENDEGLRRLFVKGQMQAAVRDALKAAGADLETGGVLAVKYDHDEPAKQRGMSPKKVYVAQYQPPAANATAANDLIGGGGASAPAAAAPPADLIGAAAGAGVSPSDL